MYIIQSRYKKILIIIFSVQAYASNVEERSADGIFPDDYDKYEPPWKKGKPAEVYIQLCVMDVDEIKDGSMEFSVQSYLMEFWKDYRLNLTRFQTDIHPVFPSYHVKKIWVPDLIFDNTRNGKLFQLSLPNTVIKIIKGATFYKASRYNLEIGCPMNFRLYPMDTQKCFLKIGTMSNINAKVELHWVEQHTEFNKESIILMTDIQPLEYTLQQPDAYKTVEVWPSGNYSYLFANFTFVRRLSGSLFNVYVPSTLVVFLSWISFWLDGENVPARVTLGVTSLLTLATQVQNAHNGLPRINYMTALDVWLFACLIMVFSALLEFAFAYQLLVVSEKKREMYEVYESEKAVTLREGIRLFKARSSDSSHKKKSQNEQNADNEIKGSSKICPPLKMTQKTLDKTSQKLFPFIFALFTVIYWTFYLS